MSEAGAVSQSDESLANAGVLTAQGGLLAGFGDRLARGFVAGIASGLVFLVVLMGWAVERLGKPAIAPLLDMSTVFNNTDIPAATPNNVVVGLVTHLTLSMLFGMAFALIVVPLLRRNVVLLFAGGAVVGLLLYVLDFQILGRTLFKWFTNPLGPPQEFEVFAHVLFGVLLVPFFIGMARRFRLPAA